MDPTEELMRQQAVLQAEASAVEDDLQLGNLVRSVGEPIRVGSAALGLMVWRDLDLTVICHRLDVAAVAALVARLATNRRVRQVTLLNDTGEWNVDPTYPDGVYLGVTYRSPSGDDWKIDIWFVSEPDRQPDLEHLRTIPPQLNDERRAAILLIKSAWASRPEYGRSVRSFDIYRAVLKHGVRTREDFEQWIASHDQTHASGDQGIPPPEPGH